MDEYPQQKASRNLFSKGPTKNDGGRKGFFKGFRRKSEVVGICSSTGGGSEKKNGTSHTVQRERICSFADKQLKFMLS